MQGSIRDQTVGLTVPERIGRYRIISEIGHGGMAVVYRAVLDGPGGFAKEVCLKRILPSGASDPHMLEMFQREARLAAGLQHANVVQVFDFDLWEDSPFLVMELVDGGSLAEIWRAGTAGGRTVPLDIAAAVAVGVLGGLHHVHTRTHQGRPMGLVHRDVSLHNILLSRAGDVKVADFGIARANLLGEHTKSGVLKGKFSYIAPEYVAGGAADHRGDIFSAGVVLHELVTGTRRVPPGSDAECIAWMLHSKLPPVQDLRPDAPDSLANLVASLVAVHPDERPESALEAAAQLARAVPPASQESVAAYVRRMLPAAAGAARDRTQRLEMDGVDVTAPAAAPTEPTATRVPTGAGGRSVPLVPPRDLTPDASTVVDRRPPPPARPAVSPVRRYAPWFGAAAVAVAVIAAVRLFSSGGSGGSAPAVRPPDRAAAAPSARPPAGPVVSAVAPAPRTASVPEADADAARIAVSSPSGSAGEGPAATPPAPASPPSVAAGAGVPGEAGRPGPIRRAVESPVPVAVPVPVPSSVPSPVVSAEVPERPPPRAEPAFGTLDVHVMPWAYVSIDGGEEAECPVRDLRVPAGRRRIRLRNPAMPCDITFSENVPEDGHVVVRRDLRRECVEPAADGADPTPP